MDEGWETVGGSEGRHSPVQSWGRVLALRPEDGRGDAHTPGGSEVSAPGDPCQLSPGGTSKTLLERRCHTSWAPVSQASRALRAEE